MKVRTSLGALVTGAILSGILAVVAMGDGREPEKPATPSVVISPLDPNRSLPSVKASPDGAPAPTAQPRPQPAQPQPRFPPPGDFTGPPDAYAPVFLRGGLTYILIFLLAHLALQRANVSRRWAYAGIGAVSAAAAVASMTPAWGWRTLIAQGRLSECFGIVSAFGAIIGFLYVWRAGLAPEGDDPAALARALEPRTGEASANGTADHARHVAAPDAEISDDAALVAVDRTEYFEGPLQVRTSIPVMFVAALVSSGVYCTGLILLGAASEISAKLHASLPFLSEISGAVETKAVFTLATGIVTAFPATFLIYLTHWALRGLNKQSYLGYGLAGFAAPVLLGLIAGPLGALLGFQVTVPMAIAMSVYRNMAGMEPKPVKEDIFVRDRRNLVGARHARRQYGRVVNL